MNAPAPQSPTTPRAVLHIEGEREIRVERIFDAPRERVWRAHTDPDLLRRWWGRGNPLDVERYELVPGGHWRFVEHTDDGSHGFEGRFSEIEAPRRLVMTFEWDGLPGHVALQTLELDELEDGRTRLRSTSLFMTGADRDGMVQSGMEGGMNESYAALDRVLASKA